MVNEMQVKAKGIQHGIVSAVYTGRKKEKEGRHTSAQYLLYTGRRSIGIAATREHGIDLLYIEEGRRMSAQLYHYYIQERKSIVACSYITPLYTGRKGSIGIAHTRRRDKVSLYIQEGRRQAVAPYQGRRYHSPVYTQRKKRPSYQGRRQVSQPQRKEAQVSCIQGRRRQAQVQVQIQTQEGRRCLLYRGRRQVQVRGRKSIGAGRRQVYPVYRRNMIGTMCENG